MNSKDFMKAWIKGTKEFSNSMKGQLQATIIITGFIALGCFLGAWQRHIANDGILAFILFAIGLLQVIGFNQGIKSYKLISEQERAFEETKKEMEDE